MRDRRGGRREGLLLPLESSGCRALSPFACSLVSPILTRVESTGHFLPPRWAMGQIWGQGTELTLPIQTSRKEILPATSQPARKFLLDFEALPQGLLLQEPPFSCPASLILSPPSPYIGLLLLKGKLRPDFIPEHWPWRWGKGAQAACPS